MLQIYTMAADLHACIRHVMMKGEFGLPAFASFLLAISVLSGTLLLRRAADGGGLFEFAPQEGNVPAGIRIID